MSVRWFSNIFHVKDGNAYKNMGVLKGEKGDMGPKGDPGDPGNDGYSPTASVAKSGHTSTITITDKNGTTTAQVTDGSDASAVEITIPSAYSNIVYVGATLPAASAEYVTSPTSYFLCTGDMKIYSVLATADAETGDSVYLWDLEATLVTTPETAKDYYLNFDGEYSHFRYSGTAFEQVGGSSLDVQINGTSVVTDGVAEIPIANGSTLGVSKVNGSGLNIINGQIIISRSSSAEIKTGTNEYKPIVPISQHASTFYGLAKAAGDTTQSQSSNAVGQYTDSAKSSIRTMLGALSATSDVITIAASDWSNDGSCTKNVTGVTSGNTVIITYHPQFEEEYTAAGIWCTGQGSGVLYFSCKNIPSTAISVNILILNGVYDQS